MCPAFPLCQHCVRSFTSGVPHNLLNTPGERMQLPAFYMEHKCPSSESSVPPGRRSPFSSLIHWNGIWPSTHLRWVLWILLVANPIFIFFFGKKNEGKKESKGKGRRGRVYVRMEQLV